MSNGGSRAATPPSPGRTHNHPPAQLVVSSPPTASPLTSGPIPPRVLPVKTEAGPTSADSAQPSEPLPYVPATTSSSQFAPPTPLLADSRPRQAIASGNGGVAPLGGVAPHPQISVGGAPFDGFSLSHPNTMGITMGIAPPVGVMGVVHSPAGHSVGDAVGAVDEYRHYRFSVDLRTFQNSALEPGIRCYLR